MTEDEKDELIMLPDEDLWAIIRRYLPPVEEAEIAFKESWVRYQRVKDILYDHDYWLDEDYDDIMNDGNRWRVTIDELSD